MFVELVLLQIGFDSQFHRLTFNFNNWDFNKNSPDTELEYWW